MGEFLAVLFHLLPDCGPLRPGICGITASDRSLCFAPTSPDLAAISHGPVMGGRTAGRRAVRPPARPGGRRRGDEWNCRSIRNHHPADLTAQQRVRFTATGLWILAGTALMLGGGAFCGWSGYLREVEARERDESCRLWPGANRYAASTLRQVGLSLTLGLAVGFGHPRFVAQYSPGLRGGILKAAQDQGAQSSWAPFAVWPIALLGGSVANIVYSLYLLQKNRTWGWFKNLSVRETLIPFLAACLWMAGIALYSSGTTFLGSLGISIGYAAFMITMIISGQFAGLMTGEWHSMNPRTFDPSPWESAFWSRRYWR